VELFNLFVVAIIQGLTEFLPVSSSGHLILYPLLTGAADQGQAIDAAVHFGTLGAVTIYFWRDVRLALIGLVPLMRGRLDQPGARLALMLIIATIPAIAFGIFLKITGLDEQLRSVAVIGWTMLLFGGVLYLTDQFGKQDAQASDWSLKHAILIGLAQAVALIPGTSRSGITISAARMLGYKRKDAAKISMLMSIPVIIASTTLISAEILMNGETRLAADAVIAALLALVSALLAIKLMLGFLQRYSFTPYVIYRVALGVFLLWYAYG